MTTWGGYLYNGTRWLRLGYDFTQTPASVGSGDASVNLNLKIYIQTNYGVADTSNSFDVSGNWSYSGAVSVSLPTGGGTQLLFDTTIAVSTVYAATVLRSFAASISGINVIPGTATVSGSHSVGARPYTVPAAPTSPTVTRVSDTPHTVAWTINPTTGAPYTTQNVQRWDNVSAVWATVASGISGAAVSYSDTTTVANRKYKYRIVAVNSAGSTTSAETAETWTTPGPPTGAAAVKDASNNIVITWTPGCSYTEFETQIWESQDGGAYALLTTVTGVTVSYTHVAPSLSVTHRYQVRHKTTSMSPILYSAYSTTGVVTLAAAPNAPSGLAPSGIALDASAAIVFTWVHNPVDSSPQTQFQVRHRVVGSGVWTTESAVVSAVSSWTLPAATYANGQDIEWDVKTWGVFASAGPFSATATFTASTPPTVNITSPVAASTLTTSTVSVTWAYFDAESTPQASWATRLINGGDVLETLSGAGTATTADFITPIYDGETYTIEAEVRDGSGLWSTTDSVTFDVDYLPPADVLVEAIYNEESGTVSLNLQPQSDDPGITEPATLVTIRRRVDNGEWVTIATQVPADATVLDTTPGIHNVNEYEITVFSATPSSKVMDPTTIVTTEEMNRGFLSTGGSFDTILLLQCDLDTLASTARAKALHHFAGRPLPVEFSGESLTKVVSVSGTTPGGDSAVDDFEDFAWDAAIVCWRDPTGRRIFGSIGPVGTNLRTMSAREVWDINFQVSMVDYAG